MVEKTQYKESSKRLNIKKHTILYEEEPDEIRS